MMSVSFRFQSFLLLLVLLLTACESPTQKTVWLPAWMQASSLNVARAGAAAFVHDRWLFVAGGVDGKRFLDTIERAEIRSDGSLGEWSIVARMPEPRGFFDAQVVNGFVYIVGGGNGENGKNLLQSSFRASLSSDGSLGQWKSQSALLVPRRCVKLFTYKGTMYALGGFGGSLLDTVEYASLDEEGNLSDWNMMDQRMTVPRYVNAVKVVEDDIYVLGGHHQTKGSGIALTETLKLSQNKSQWQQHEPLLQGRYGLSALTVENRMYALGGLSGLEYLSSVEKKVEQGWQQTTELPYAMANFSALTAGNRIYLVGGVTRDHYLSSVHYAETNLQGDIGIFVSKAEAEAYRESLANAKPVQKASQLPNQGSVIDVIQTEQYTYVQVYDGREVVWLAGPVTVLQKGDSVQFSQGVFMSGFYSKYLNRHFPKILFVSQLQLQQ